MIGKRRLSAAALGAAALLLATAQPSTGVETTGPAGPRPHASGPATDFPAARGTTLRTPGARQSMVSGNGRWQVYSDGYTVYARDLQHPDASPQALSIGNSTIGNGSPDVLGQKTTPDGAIPSGPSSQPSISADGRYVSFLTYAMNITPVPPAIEGVDISLVVCDRDPSGARDAKGEPLLDQKLGGNSYPDLRCEYVYSVYNGFGNEPVDTQRPRLSADGTHIVFVRKQTSQPNGAYVSVVANGSGLVTPNPVPVGVRLSGATATTYPGAQDAWLDADASNAYFVVPPAGGDHFQSMLIRTSLSNGTSIRLDAAPADLGGGYLGDGQGTAIPGEILDLGVAQNGSAVVFEITEVVMMARQRPRLAAVPQLDGRYAFVEHVSGSSVTGELLSRDNDGNTVESGAVAISGDGRYAAFATSWGNTHDGTDVTGTQVVERDLTIDAARAAADPVQARLPGALVTAATDCTPVAPAVTCGSSSSAPVTDLDIDTTGYRVAFESAAPDLAAGDSGAGVDAFARTWTPTFGESALDFGDVQVGTQSIDDVPVTVSGFGPATVTAPILSPSGTNDFSVDGSTCGDGVLYDGSECDIEIRATPSTPTPALKKAVVHLPSANGDASPAVATLTANAVTVGPVAARADTERTSLDPSGGQAPDGGYSGMISGDGRWQVFVGDDDLTGRGGGFQNVFVRDLGDPRNTVQISLHSRLGATPLDPSRPAGTPRDPAGSSPKGSSFAPSISADGRFVSFLTTAPDVVPARDLGAHGDTPSTTLVVCDRDPEGTKDTAGNLVLDHPQDGSDVPDYVCYPVESAYDGEGAGGPTSERPRLSADGTRIAWVETDSLFANAGDRVRVATISTRGGALHAPDSYLFAPSDIPGFRSSGTGRDTPVLQRDPMLTADGSAVVFTARQCCSRATLTPNRGAIVESTLPADISRSTSRRFDVVPGAGTAYLGDGIALSGDVGLPSVSGDGTRVAFEYRHDAAAFHRVYVATARAGAVTSVLASSDNAGNPTGAIEPALSGDGRYLAYVATQPNSSNGVDAEGRCDDGQVHSNVNCQVVSRDLVADARRSDANARPVPSELVSRSVLDECVDRLPAGRVCGGDDVSSGPSVDETGSEIAFDSLAGDLVPDDTNLQPVLTFGPRRAAPSLGASAIDTFVSTWRPTPGLPSLDLGSVRIGATGTRTFAVTLSGFGPLSLGRTSIGGTDAADFRIVATTCTAATLHQTPPPESCTYRIEFAPTAPGIRTATLQAPVGRNGYPRTAPGGAPSYDPVLVRTLSGFGAAAVAQVSPAVLDFGLRLPEAPVTRTVTVRNTGSAPLTVESAAVTDSTQPGARGDYAVDPSGCAAPVVPGGSCPIRVTFRGHRVGVRNARMTIRDDATVPASFVTLEAEVGRPDVRSNPAVSPVRRVITVTGTGYAPNHPVDVGFDHVRQVTVTAKDDGSFSVQMVVLGDGPQGPRMLFARSVGYDSSISAEFPFLVVLSSTDPGVVVKRD